MKRILNLGCGNDFYGTDRLDFKETKATTMVCDIEKPLPFKDNTFDEIKCYGVFEHLKNNGLVVDEMYRVLKKGGEVDLTTCNAGFIVYHTLKDHSDYVLKAKGYNRNCNDFHRHLFVPSHLKAWFKEFEDIEVEYFLRSKYGWKKFICSLLPFHLGYEALRLKARK